VVLRSYAENEGYRWVQKRERGKYTSPLLKSKPSLRNWEFEGDEEFLKSVLLHHKLHGKFPTFLSSL
jgi:hypothetical protein